MNRWRWVQQMVDSDLPATTRLVAHTMASFADGKGHCWPSYSAIARRAGLSRSTTVLHVHALVEEGWLMLSNRVSKHGKRSNSYLLSTPSPVDKQGVGSPGAGLGVVREMDYLVREPDYLGSPGDGHRTPSQGIGTDERTPTAEVHPHLKAIVDGIGRRVR